MPISKLSPIEYRLLKEKVIREYKTKLESQITEHPYEIYIRRFKALIPLNLALGFLASMGYIY